jgi:transcription elongation factor GreA
MNPKKIYLTLEGLETLKKEYDELTKIKRPKVVQELSDARSQGDLSENGAYTAAKEELSFVDGRIEELEVLIKQASVIKDNPGGKTISLGSQVTVNIKGKEELYHLVGEWEADPLAKKISHESPLGKALIGKAVGDEVAFEAPAGKMIYKIISIG